MACRGLLDFVLFVTPVVVLPLAIFLPDSVMVALTTGFLLYHGTNLFVRKFLPPYWVMFHDEQMVSICSSKALTTYAQFQYSTYTAVPFLFLFPTAALYLPEGVLGVSDLLLSWLGPIFMLVEAWQISRLGFYFSRALLEKGRTDASLDQQAKAFLSVLSLLLYAYIGYAYYSLFTDPFLGPALASFFSVTCTLIVVLFFLVMAPLTAVERGSIVDMALVGSYVAFLAGLTAPRPNTVLSYLLDATPGLGLQAVVGAGLTVLALLTISVPLADNDIPWDKQQEEGSLWALTNIVGITAYSTWLRTLSGAVPAAGAAFRVLQTLLALLTCLFLAMRESYYDQRLHWKFD